MGAIFSNPDQAQKSRWVAKAHCSIAQLTVWHHSHWSPDVRTSNAVGGMPKAFPSI
jgi:hypothetical protein